MSTKQLIETTIKMLGFIFFIYALYNALSFSSYLFMDFTNMQDAQNHFVALGISNIMTPIVVGVLLFLLAPYIANKMLPKDDKSTLLVNVSAYDLQVILLFSIAIFVALETIVPLFGFSIEYFLTDKRDEFMLYKEAQMVGNLILLILSLALALGSKTVVGWIRYMHYWYGRKD